MFTLIVGGPLDFLGLSYDPGVIEVFGFEIGDDGFGLFNVSVGDEPAGRFGEPWDGGEEDEDEDKLEGQGEAPGYRAVDKGEAVGYPGRRVLAPLVSELFYGGLIVTNLIGRSLQCSRSSR